MRLSWRMQASLDELAAWEGWEQDRGLYPLRSFFFASTQRALVQRGMIEVHEHVRHDASGVPITVRFAIPTDAGWAHARNRPSPEQLEFLSRPEGYCEAGYALYRSCLFRGWVAADPSYEGSVTVRWTRTAAGSAEVVQ